MAAGHAMSLIELPRRTSTIGGEISCYPVPEDCEQSAGESR
ncbi:hypothetical protein CCACVL1_02803 [Corchorus capsularis]|uniref:Uncharacterized protein n=1 Tax=Corchorus capsularis TaxID=210143 RepID=A0A1R3K619_COCAP|nr:hypothetical protein CCACVL1_02803 [Corchorus capsularis]